MDDTLHLLHRAGQVADSITESHLEKHNITVRQFRCLQAIENGAISQTDVVAATGIDRTTVSDICKRLAGLELITRDHAYNDGRCRILRLTGKGARTTKAATDAAAAATLQMLESVQDDEAAALHRSLTAIVDEFGPISSATTSERRIKVALR